MCVHNRACFCATTKRWHQFTALNKQAAHQTNAFPAASGMASQPLSSKAAPDLARKIRNKPSDWR